MLVPPVLQVPSTVCKSFNPITIKMNRGDNTSQLFAAKHFLPNHPPAPPVRGDLSPTLLGVNGMELELIEDAQLEFINR